MSETFRQILRNPAEPSWAHVGPHGPMFPWAHRAQAGRPRRRRAGGRQAAGSATQFGELPTDRALVSKYW